MAKDGTTLANRDFTSGGGAGAGIADQVDDSKLTALFADGATLVLQALHRTWPPLIDFTQQLAAELGHPVQVNAYVTPPQSRGFDDHYDVHDVFVLQISGRKHWRIHEPVHPVPLRDQPWTDRREAVAEAADTPPIIDAVLEPGDCLYLPRGYLHAATALGGVSTHLTFGVHTWTRHAVARTMLDRALLDLAGDADVRVGPAARCPRRRSGRRRTRRRARPRPVAARHRGAVGRGDLVRARLRVGVDRTAGADRPAGSAEGGPDTAPRHRAHSSPSSRAAAGVVRRRHPADHPGRGRSSSARRTPRHSASLLAGEPVTADVLGLDLARRLLRAGVVVPT